MPDDLMQTLIDAVADRIAARLQELHVPLSADEPRLLTVKQAATYLSRTETALRQLVAKGVENGGLPCVRADGRVMLDRLDLHEWIEKYKQ